MTFITSSQLFSPNISRVSYVFLSDGQVLPFIPDCRFACIIRPVGITNGRHVTEEDGLEPIRDIATVGRAWYVILDDRVALNLSVRWNCYCVCMGGL
jgi:hypothetical protein